MKESITSKKRILNILAGKETDRMACFSGMSMVTLAGLESIGLKFWEIHTDAKKMALAAASSYHLYGAECAVVPFDICIESEAMGCSTNFYEGIEDQILFPVVRPKEGYLVYNVEDLKKVITPNDFDQKGRFPVVKEALGILQKDLGGRIPVGAWLLGPLTWLGEMMDLRLLLRLVYKNPKELTAIVNYLADAVAFMAKKYRESGADYICIREMTGSTNMISPESFNNIVKPALIKIFKAIDYPSVLHICGDTNHIIKYMYECGADALSVELKNDIQKSREVIGDFPIILGNIDVASLMTMGTPDLIEEVVLAIMDSGVDSIWPSCDVWPGAKTENMRAMVDTVKEYGSNRWLRKKNNLWF